MLITFNLSSLSASATDVIIIDPTPDTTPPVLNSLTITATQASPGETVKLIADVTDDLSGVSTVHAYYRKPSGNSYSVSFYLNQNTGKYEGNINFNEYSEAGTWVLTSLSLSDKKNNSTSIYDSSYSTSGNKMDFSPYAIQVNGSNDKTPPDLLSVSISETQATAGSNVKVIVEATDDISGISYISGSYVKPSGKGRGISFYYNSQTGKYEGNLFIDMYEELGVWKLSSLYLSDKTGNSKTIYNSNLGSHTNAEVRDFSNCDLEVSGTTPDLLAPILDSLGITLVNKLTVKLSADFSDNLSGLSYAYAYYKKPSGNSYSVGFYFNHSTGKYEALIPIDKFDELGTWKLQSIQMTDDKQNYRTIYDISSGYSNETMDLSPFDFTVRGLVTIPPSSPFSVEIDPKTLTLEPGMTHQLNVTLHMSDATTKDVTSASAGTVYTSSNPSAVQISKDGLITVDPGASPGVVFIQAKNSGLYGQCAITISGEFSDSYLTIKPLKLDLAPGQSKQLTVEVTLADGTVKDVTLGSTGTQYTSSDTTKATVDSNGWIRVPSDAQQGTAIIQVEYNGIIGEAVVNVTGEPVIQSLAMTPNSGIVNAGDTVQLSVRAIMSDGSTKDVTQGSRGTVYTSSNSSVATVDANGLIRISDSIVGKTVTITASNGGVEAKSTFTLNSVASLTVTPGTISLAPGATQQLQVKGTLLDGSEKDLTLGSTGTTYTSNSTSVATVSADGLITVSPTARNGFKATITATNNGIRSTSVVTVQDPTPKLSSISVTPSSITLAPGATQQLQVTGTLTDGSTQDLTQGSAGTTYVSSSTSVATVSADGLITVSPTARNGFKATITAINNGIRSTSVVTVQDTTPKLSSISVTPSSISLAPGATQQLQVTGTLTDGSKQDLTQVSTGTTYVSSSTSVATVSADGLITVSPTARNGFKATITVTNNGKSATSVVTVQDTTPKLSSISVTPSSISLAPGATQQLQVTGTLTDGSTQDLTLGSAGTTYTSSSTSVATVSADGLITVSPTARNGFKATITVTNNGKTATSVVTVQDTTPKLSSISVTPSSISLAPGATQQLQVTGTLTDGSTQDLTQGSAGTTYTSSSTSVATVSADGLITVSPTARNGFKATITVTNNGKTATSVVTVQDTTPKLSSISVTPSSISLAPGATQQLQVTGTLTDGSTQDLTLGSTGTTYTSNSTSVATVSADGLITVSPTARNGFKTTITISNNGVRTTVTIVVVV
jgi:VCBS repeat-containing protein